MMTCSAPPDCAEIERRRATGIGLLVDGGASRGNLLSGEAEDVILTVSRMEEEKKANPGYRAFLANGDNVDAHARPLRAGRSSSSGSAALRAIRRDVRPRGHRGGIYPLMRAALCVFVRDLIVSGVLTDMMRGRPAVYATFSSYDEVAHHSGLERADTLEALRKLDDHFAADRARPPLRAAAVRDRRPLRPRADAGRDLQAAQRLRPRRARRALARAGRRLRDRRRRRAELDGRPRRQRGDRQDRPSSAKNDVSDRDVVVLGSGNLGLVYLMEERRRLTLEELDERHPRAAARSPRAPRTSAGCSSAPPSTAPSRSAPAARTTSRRAASRARTRSRLLAHRAPAPAAHRRLRARRRHHGRQLLRPRARRGLRLRGADLLPRRHRRPADASVHPPPHRTSTCPPEPIIGAASVHGILAGWRQELQGAANGALPARAAQPVAPAVAEPSAGHTG